MWCGALAAVLIGGLSGCARYNTFYNAEKAFDNAEDVRKERLKHGEDVTEPTAGQRADYDRAIQKAQKILDNHPGNSLTDDALFMQAKAHHRLMNYRSSIRKFDLLFANFPATDYEEEAIFLQALNYMHIGNVVASQEYLEKLEKSYPESRFRAEALRVRGESSFVLERWEAARDAFHLYLERYPDASGHDEIAYKLGLVYWELEDYASALPVLKDVVESDIGTETAFRAELLEARCQSRLGHFDVFDDRLPDLRREADVYGAQGEVALAEAESRVARGDDDRAASILETLPDEWVTNTLRPRIHEVLGHIRLRRGDWEEARKDLEEAVRGRRELEDPQRTELLLTHLRDYLAAEQQLVDAKDAEVPRLKLLQANALLFGFDRPAAAGGLYLDAAGDAAADSLLAARALYGAQLVYRQYLDKPDSAALIIDELRTRFPESPQTYQLEHGGESDLVAFLLTIRAEEQLERRREIAEEGELADETATGRRPGGGGGLRRRKVYLQRRPDLVFPPPPAALHAHEEAHPEAEPGAATLATGGAAAGVPTGGESGAAAPGPPAGGPVQDTAFGAESGEASGLPGSRELGAAPDTAAIDKEVLRLEQERLEQQRLEQERLEQERLEQERLEQERAERERREAEERRRSSFSAIGGARQPEPKPQPPDTSGSGG
jgi:outer membrane protein assembly factor BamD (BamD/ComL family)